MRKNSINLIALLVVVIALLTYGVLYERFYLILWAFTLLTFLIFRVFHKFRDYSIVTVSLILSLSLFETGLILLKSINPMSQSHFDSESEYPAKYYTNSDLGVQPMLGKYRALKISSHNSVIYDITYTIGADRFRITPQTNQLNEPRVNFFGDSFMIGEGVQDNETLPYYFQTIQPKYYVKNFGSHGFGVHQALAILESKRITAGTLNFLLTAPWHAERMVCIPNESAINNPVYKVDEFGGVTRNGDCRAAEENPPPPHQKSIKIFYKSELGKLLRVVSRSGVVQDRQIELYLAMIKQMSTLSNKRNQKFIVGFIKADENYFYGKWTNKKIREQLNSWGIELIDMTLADKSENINEEYFIHKEEGHPSAYAHAKRASILANFMILQDQMAPSLQHHGRSVH